VLRGDTSACDRRTAFFLLSEPYIWLVATSSPGAFHIGETLTHQGFRGG